MNKKISPLFFLGALFNMIGIVLMRVFADLQHNWVPIPIALLGLALIIISVYKAKKNNTDI